VLESPELEAKFRQPRVFGPLPGPRNVPENRRHLAGNMDVLSLSISARTDAGCLEALLPPRCRLAGEPVLTVTVNYLSNIGWLAGHGYNILSTSFRIRFDGQDGSVVGAFTPVLWESLPDPILTGREELGFSKLWAEIPEPLVLGNSYATSASWKGYRWFELELGDLQDGGLVLPSAAARDDGELHYRFMPRVGAQDQAEAEYMVLIPVAPGPASTRRGDITRRLVGDGWFHFNAARWEDVPFHYPIINALAGMPLVDFHHGTVTFSKVTGASPAGDAVRRVQ
jgi:hypothetical protein